MQCRLGVPLEIIKTAIEFRSLRFIERQLRLNFLRGEAVPEVLSEFDPLGRRESAEVEERVRPHVQRYVETGDNARPAQHRCAR